MVFYSASSVPMHVKCILHPNTVKMIGFIYLLVIFLKKIILFLDYDVSLESYIVCNKFLSYSYICLLQTTAQKCWIRPVKLIRQHHRLETEGLYLVYSFDIYLLKFVTIQLLALFSFLISFL